MIRIPESFGIGNSAQGSWNPGSTDKKSGPRLSSMTLYVGRHSTIHVDERATFGARRLTYHKLITDLKIVTSDSQPALYGKLKVTVL